MEFGRPPEQSDFTFQKFIRVDDRLYVTSPEDSTTSHEDLAFEDGISGKLWKAKSKDPARVDAGYMVTRNYNGFKEIELSHCSSTLNLPVEEAAQEARQRSAETVRKMCPDYSVLSKEDL